ncbi:kinase-like domain-containing protein [Gigaspora margarita]|uniref:Kinase-like domain-containing protein n=1 Tax=Gigaspora margarita TaxID=4874 RepID=A0A8H4ANT7_GIGMA|nr:kinase-like domain-containing protein [Gigaspora margarita]
MGQQYKQASDIYSLGVIATEISTGRRAFDGIPFDDYFALSVVGGSRPKCLGPDCYIKLAMKCMDEDVNKRPTATGIIEIITHWLDEMDQENDSEIKKQFLEADKIKSETIKQIHPQEMYTSKIYDTKKISYNLSKSISEIEIPNE